MIFHIAYGILLLRTKRKDNIFISAMCKSKTKLPLVNLEFPNSKAVLVPIV